MSGAFELRAMGRLLAQGRTLDRASRILFALSGAGLLLAAFAFGGAGASSSVAALALGFVAGLVQTYYAVRVAFDAELVSALADRSGDVAIPADPAALVDASLQSLGLLGPDAAGRDWAARWQGMQRLMRRQATCLMLQAVAFLVAVGFALLRNP